MKSPEFLVECICLDEQQPEQMASSRTLFSFHFLVKQPHAKIKDCLHLFLCVKMSDTYSKIYKLRVQKNTPSAISLDSKLISVVK